MLPAVDRWRLTDAPQPRLQFAVVGNAAYRCKGGRQWHEQHWQSSSATGISSPTGWSPRRARTSWRLFKEMDIEPVILDESDTKLGAVETWAHAKRCAELFKQQRDRIDGILVTLPNFGDEKGVADTIKLSGLNVPILVQAYPDDLKQLSASSAGATPSAARSRSATTCASTAMPITLTELHTVHPAERELPGRPAAASSASAGWSRGCAGRAWARSARGPTPSTRCATARSCCESYGISVSTIDLSEIFGQANKLADDDARVARQAGGDQRLCHDRRRARAVAGQDGQAGGGAGSTGWTRTTSTPRRCSAGTRSRPTTASTPAR